MIAEVIHQKRKIDVFHRAHRVFALIDASLCVGGVGGYPPWKLDAVPSLIRKEELEAAPEFDIERDAACVGHARKKENFVAVHCSRFDLGFTQPPLFNYNNDQRPRRNFTAKVTFCCADMSDVEDDIDDQLLELAGATTSTTGGGERKKRRQHSSSSSGGNAGGGSRKRKAE